MASKSKKEKNIIFTEEHVDEESSNGAFADTKPSMVENIISVILGLAVVVVIGAMVVNVIKNRNNPSQPPTAA